jgi:outer membrane protein insertion porin family
MKIMFLLLLLPILMQPVQHRATTHGFAALQQEAQADEEVAKEIRCGQLVVRGSEQLTQTELCHLLDGVIRNPLDSQSRNFVQASLIREYHRRGFLEAALSWDEGEKQADPSAAAVVLIVKEGPAYQLRRLEMTGNATTRDRVIRRRVALEEGTTFDEELLELSIKRINRLGIFEEFTSEDVEVRVNKKGHFVDLTFRLREK